MIIFKTLKWKNFLSTGNTFTEIKLNENKRTLVIGENGSGKSTFLDALTYALFNKPFRNINKPQLVNSITGKSLVVELYFDIGQNSYKIIRGMKPNIFEIYVNDTLLNQSSESKDYQEILEKQIIKCNYKSFCQVVVLGSAKYKPFMELPSASRREIIEDLLDLQIFSVMNVILKDKINKNNEEISTVGSNKRIYENKIELIKEHIIEKQKNTEKHILLKQNQIKELLKNVNDLKKKSEEINNNIEDLKSKIKDEEKIKSKLKELEFLKHKIENNLSLLNKDITFLKKNDDCPTCKQFIDNNFKNKSIKEKEKEIDQINDGLEKLIKQYNTVQNKIKTIIDINAKINTYQMSYYDTEHKITTCLDKIAYIKSDIEKIKNNNIEDEQDKLNKIQQDFNKIIEDYNYFVEEKGLYSAASILLKDSGIKSTIIKQYIPIINKLISKYLSTLNFYVQFELDEEFKEIIKSRYRDDFSYESFSEGEKMRINLAILFTWRSIAKLRNSINTNILILDEVFDSSLDMNGIEDFIKLIDEFSNDTNIFIISHKKDQLIEKFDNIIKVEKHKNFSKVIT